MTVIGLVALMGLAVAACSTSDNTNAGSSAGPATTADTAEAAAPESTTLPSATTAASSTVVETSAPAPTTTTTTEPPRVWDGLDRLTVMLLGSDAGAGRTGTRTDTIILVTVDPRTGDAAMFSIPRNLTEAPLPDGMGLWNCDCFPDILTHLWANAEWFPDAFPGPQEPPINALKATLGLMFDVEVDYYAKVDLAGFAGLFDALGGVAIDAPARVYDPSYPHENGSFESIAIEAGEQVLDGHEALAYSRIRYNSGDFARMHRQRCVLGSLLANTDPDDLLGAASFAAAIGEFVETDIPLDHLGDFVELLSRVDLDRMATLRITSHKYGTTGHAGYQIYDLEQIRADAHALMEDPTLLLETHDGDGWDDICSKSFD